MVLMVLLPQPTPHLLPCIPLLMHRGAKVEEIFSQLSASVLTGSHKVNQDEGTKLGGYVRVSSSYNNNI